MNKPIKILYVDDEPINLKLFQLIFNKLYEVIVVDNHSQDNSIKEIKRRFPKTKLIKLNSENTEYRWFPFDSLPSDKKNELRQRIIDGLIAQELVYDDAKKIGILFGIIISNPIFLLFSNHSQDLIWSVVKFVNNSFIFLTFSKSLFVISFIIIPNVLLRIENELFNKCISLNNKISEIYSNRGVAYNNLGQYDKAVDDYLNAIKLNPNFSEALCNLGVTYNHLKKFDKAIISLKKALELRPDFTSALINIGISYRNLLKLENAHKQFETALNLEPNNELIHFQQGLTFFSEKKIFFLKIF